MWSMWTYSYNFFKIIWKHTRLKFKWSDHGRYLVSLVQDSFEGPSQIFPSGLSALFWLGN